MSLEGTVTRAVRGFATVFGGTAQGVVQAPGRINLIGEHTDYNGGFVLPCAIDRYTVIAWRRIAEPAVRCVALDLANSADTFSLSVHVVRSAEHPWANYVRGMAQGLLDSGVPLCGAELAIASDVPAGAGLSSSAALEMAAGHALLAAAEIGEFDRENLARLGQQAERDYAGCNCGLMDQLSSALGISDHALLIDCESAKATPVALPPGTAMMAAHSMVHRQLVGSEYNVRRADCELAARALGVSSLRHAGLTELMALPLDGRIRSRARHVITENARTIEAARMLALGDLTRMGALMAASHASLRDDFEVSLPPIDRLVAIMQDAVGTEGGARMTGAGFGGCVVGVMPDHRVPLVCEAIAAHYRSPGGEPADVFICRASAGAGRIVPLP